jgi:hypothetical protein
LFAKGYRDFINSSYEKIFDDPKILSYVKFRNDTSTSITGTRINPRYLIQVDKFKEDDEKDENAYLLMRYNNIDKHLGTDHNSKTEAYNIMEFTNNIKSDNIEEKVYIPNKKVNNSELSIDDITKKKEELTKKIADNNKIIEEITKKLKEEPKETKMKGGVPKSTAFHKTSTNSKTNSNSNI